MLALKRFDLAHPVVDDAENLVLETEGEVPTSTQSSEPSSSQVESPDLQPKMTPMQLILQKAIELRRREHHKAEAEAEAAKVVVDPKKARSDYLVTLNKEFKEYEQEMINKTDVQLKPDSIVYWKSHSSKYTILGPTALDLISCPMTEVSVERLFSHLSFILCPLRNRLTGDILQDILFLRLNRRFGVISDTGRKKKIPDDQDTQTQTIEIEDNSEAEI